MTEKKAYTVTDLGGGDGGKGGVVHKLCSFRTPHTVIKVGGAQGHHGVTTSRGERFAFSQFGCGTFNGSRTFVTDRFVISPLGFLNEAKELRYEHGIYDPLSRIAVDENALVTTPFHGIASRLRELARKENPKGTVGVGVGEAFLDAELFPELAIKASDLKRPGIRKKLRAAYAQKLCDLALVLEADYLSDDVDAVQKQIDLIRTDGFLDWIGDVFEEFGRSVRIVDHDYLRREVLSRDGVIVIESSHGVLTDRFNGFHPHTTRLRTLPEITSWSLLRENGWNGDVVKIGVTRSYQIRHGAGPLVVDDKKMAEVLLPEEVGKPDRYRGKVRVGPLDFVSLRYAKEVSGGDGAFDAVAMTWFDTPLHFGVWDVCNRYEGELDPAYFTKEGEIIVRKGEGDKQLWYQEGLGKALMSARPVISRHKVPDGSKDGAIALAKELVAENLGIPLRMLAFGPTEHDKSIF